MDKKLGVYICEGCGIAESINIDKLEAAIKKYNIPVTKIHPILCSPDGVEIIKKDMEGEGVNTIVIVACSPRVKYQEFNFPGFLTERVNIREFVAWSQPPNTEDTQLLAEDYLKMGIVKAQKGDLLEPYMEEVDKTLLVIGGGISGITSALEAANAGYNVTLVEKNPELGGWASKVYKQLPQRYPFEDLEEPNVISKIKEVESHPNIKILTSSVVENIAGYPGHFDFTVRKNGISEVLRAGAIIFAVGWRPYDPNKLDHLGYGRYPDVITNVQMEEIASKGKITRPSDGKEAKRVVFIQCAGSRDPGHLPYCSSFCCLTSLKQAAYLREKNQDAVAYIIYKDIRTPGQYELFYKKVQNDPAIMLTKGDVIGVSVGGNESLFVEVDNTIIDGKILLEADLVVLATGMVPVTREALTYLDGLTKASSKGDEEKARYIESTQRPEFILNLQYRQGPELPPLEEAYGFADSNFICFQYETRRTGIYSAGSVRQPMNMLSSIEDAKGAALKAIQCIESISKGYAVHPRAWDMGYPEVNLTKCTACKRCTEECPFGAIDEDEKGIPYHKIMRCRRCGTCFGSCPERIISFKDFSIDMISSMIKAIYVPEEEEETRIVAMVCENDAYPSLDTAGINRKKINPNIRFIPIRCLGAMNLVWVADALSKGIDGMLLLGCKFGENYQCHFIKGSELADYRLGKIRETLDRLRLESERVRLVQLAISDYDRIPEILDELVERIKEIGPNPYKGL